LAFTFPEQVPHVAGRLIGDSCARFILAVFSLATVHLALTIPQHGGVIWNTASIVWLHLMTRDLGLVLLWSVLVTLFQQLFTQGKPVLPGAETLGTQGKAIASSFVVVAVVMHLSRLQIESRLSLVCAAALYLLSTAAWMKVNWLPSRARDLSRGNPKNVLVVGAGRVGQDIAEYLASNQRHGRVVRGFLDSERWRDCRILGTVGDLAEVARAEFIDEIIVAEPYPKERAQIAIIEALRNHLDVRIVPELFGPAMSDRSVPIPVLPLHEEAIPELGLCIKRTMDLALAAAGLLALAPFLLVIALVIRLDSPGPVLYRAPRIGKKGRRFLCCKFRTMVLDADRMKESLRRCNERDGPLFKVTGDPRITKIGRFLRCFSLDELPQLWNVICGEMSLVGPRPHPLDDYERYELHHLRRLDVTPGITGLWQITARRDPSFYKNMELDLTYIDSWSLWLDLRILAQTLAAVLAGSGA
jgi:exopolysaccharide biosynthesis polyprenyl glycosylphosphotransferase